MKKKNSFDIRKVAGITVLLLGILLIGSGSYLYVENKTYKNNNVKEEMNKDNESSDKEDGPNYSEAEWDGIYKKNDSLVVLKSDNNSVRVKFATLGMIYDSSFTVSDIKDDTLNCSMNDLDNIVELKIIKKENGISVESNNTIYDSLLSDNLVGDYLKVESGDGWTNIYKSDNAELIIIMKDESYLEFSLADSSRVISGYVDKESLKDNEVFNESEINYINSFGIRVNIIKDTNKLLLTVENEEGPFENLSGTYI